jgi:ABC-type transporter Mla subunit MlaD
MAETEIIKIHSRANRKQEEKMSIFRRIIGVLLILAAILGLIVSIGAMYIIWNVQDNITTSLQNTIDLLGQTLETTAQGLVVTQAALQNSVDMIGSLQSTVETTAEAIGTMDPLLEEISGLLAEKLPNTIRATQTSLETAQQSAATIDTVLRAMSGIPLIGPSIGYDPQVPLSDALGDVAQQLENIPDTFLAMEEKLATTQSSMQTFQADLTVMADSVGQIQASVAQYDQVIGGYQASLERVLAQLETLSANLPNIVRTLTIGLTAFLVWMAIAQIGLFTQGWELLTETKEQEEKETKVEEQEPEKAAEPAEEAVEAAPPEEDKDKGEA